jgi:hypothetical protein
VGSPLKSKSDSPKHVLSATSTVVVAGDPIWLDLDGEVAILNLNKGMYYGLNSGGASIWGLLREPRTVSQILDALLKEYEVEPELCREDLMRLLSELAEVGLIEVKNESAQEIPDSLHR